MLSTNKDACTGDLKAYIVETITGLKYIWRAYCKEEARREVAFEMDCSYKDVTAKRAKWADKYEDPENIPKWVLLQHDFPVACDTCGEFAYFDECDCAAATDEVICVLCKMEG